MGLILVVLNHLTEEGEHKDPLCHEIVVAQQKKKL